VIITQLRTYEKTSTKGELYVDGKKLAGETLEDCGRPQGVKIQDETCIPEGEYSVQITLSNRFKKLMIVLYNEPSDHSVRDGTVKWTGIRVHSGVTIEHTAGCVLYKQYPLLQDMIQRALDAKEPVYWVIGQKP
jgi:hypothetical protein